MTASGRRSALGRIGIGAAIAAAATLLAWVALRFSLVETLELKTYDSRMRATARPSSPSKDVVVVWIDEDSIRRMDPIVGRWPWPRMAHASLIDFLSRGGAKVIVYDVLFSEADLRGFTMNGVDAEGKPTKQEISGEESDDAFAESVRNAGNVVLAGEAMSNELVDTSKSIDVPLDGIPSLDRPYAPGDCFEVRPRFTPPTPVLANAARALGHTFSILDDDGVTRRIVPFVRVKDRYVPSLSVAGVLLAKGLDDRAVTSDESGLHVAGATTPLVDQTISDYSGRTVSVCRGLLSYRGPKTFEGRPTFDEYSFYDLFEAQLYFDSGDVPEDRRGKLIEPAVFKDKIVVVGTNSASLFDVFVSPFVGQFPGPLVHANAIDALLEDRGMAPAPTSAGLAGTTAAALIVGVCGAVLSPWWLSAVAAALSGAIVWASVYWFAQGLWIPLVQPLLAVALAFVGQLSWQYFVEGREKRQVKKLFSRYVPKDVYEQLMADPNRAALGGRRRTMTVLFSDVRGFTAMSEKATPEEVVGQLNEYFSRMVQVLFEHRGTLDKFVGDMVMGLFGAPLDDPDHAEHAVQTAIAMSRALDDLNREWGAAGRPQLDIGIGISTGEMVAGNIGSEAIMSYTVIGDRVNLGARLESLNKEYGTRIIISEATRAALQGRYETRPLGEVVVKGKSQPVAIYEVKES